MWCYAWQNSGRRRLTSAKQVRSNRGCVWKRSGRRRMTSANAGRTIAGVGEDRARLNACRPVLVREVCRKAVRKLSGVASAISGLSGGAVVIRAATTARAVGPRSPTHASRAVSVRPRRARVAVSQASSRPTRSRMAESAALERSNLATPAARGRSCRCKGPSALRSAGHFGSRMLA